MTTINPNWGMCKPNTFRIFGMPVDHEAISIAFIVVQCLAVILTFFRLGFRFKIRRFWWEDVWAMVALVCTVVSIIDSVLAVSGTNDEERILTAGRINVYIFLSVVWSVRLSLIFSIIRITHATLQRRSALVVAACYFLFWITALGFQAWYSTRISPRKLGTPPDCVLPRFIIIIELTMNCLSDMMNVVFPFKLLWRVKLPRRQRRMVLSLFFTSRFLCIFSLAHAIAQLVGSLTIQSIFANVQMSAFLIVCNLLVVVTYVYRAFLTSSESDQEPSSSSDDPWDDDDFTTPAPRSDLTTVDLESLHMSVTETTSELKSGLFSSTAPSTRSNDPER
ncbi:hypothetical protein OG21DRAFT_1437615 [Imleria badia]|nr:hypothetical protein OG21DRAFT_1437615 [Imleria badia]